MQDKGRTLCRAMVLSGTVALVLSIIMTVHSFAGVGLIGCNAGSSCDSVLGSRWSLILGILPVSLIATGLYAAFLVCLAFVGNGDLMPTIRKLLPVFAGVITGSAVHFTLLQFLVIGSVCKYCCATHFCGLVTAVLCIIWARGRQMSSRLISGLFTVGLLLSGALALFQTLTVDRNPYSEGSTGEPLPDMYEAGFPVIGDSSAPVKVEILYDYQCMHCRKIHAEAVEIAREHRGELAFVLCPTPLSPSCNPYIPADDDRFDGSCEYARLALAVWRLAPREFPEFDEWLWTLPGTGAALERASSLVGKERLRDYLASDGPFKDSALSFELFGRTLDSSSSGLPRLVCGQSWIIPETSDSDALFGLMSDIFSL